MKPRNKIDSVSVQLWYYRYRDSTWYTLVLFGGIIAISCLLFFLFIWPQMEHWFSIQDEINVAKQQTLLLQNNFNYITNVNTDLLNNNFSIVTAALPSEKDFSGIIDAITTSALSAGVPLNDFGFPVGELATKSAKMTKTTPIVVSVSITDGVDGANRFLKEIQKRVPLVSIKEVQNHDNQTTFTLEFYYKTFPPIQYNDAQPVQQVTALQQQLIEQLSQWKATEDMLSLQESATASSAIAQPPF